MGWIVSKRDDNRMKKRNEAKKNEYIRRLILARMRLLNQQGFYGLLLMHMEFALDESIETAATDGKMIYFSPQFLDDISDEELVFILMHEVLHVALRHFMRGSDLEHFIFNIACDIVVNSNVLRSWDMDASRITLKKYGESIHLTPDGKEGWHYTAEEVYAMLIDRMKKNKVPPHIKGSADSAACGDGKDSDHMDDRSEGSGNVNEEKSDNDRFGNSLYGNGFSWDNHSKWCDTNEEEADELSAVWQERLKNAAIAAKERERSMSCGPVPQCAERLLKDLKKPQIDWRQILNEFVQEEITDYSFAPPDRRFDETGFFLPDFNEKDQTVRDILFMIDASGSMSDDQVTAAYSEVYGAIEQFGGRLAGWLGFFDAKVTEPIPFADEMELKTIRPKGGGGTSFKAVFNFIKRNMADNLPVSIIVLTDGFCPFPEEKVSLGIPVLWLINNDKVDPPWGKVARMI